MTKVSEPTALYNLPRRHHWLSNKLSNAFALYRVDHNLRILWLSHVDEHLTLGQRQSIFLLAHSVVFAPTAFVILSLWASTIFIFTFSKGGNPEDDSGLSRGQGIFIRIFISIFCIVITARLMLSSIGQFLYHCLQEYRDSTHAFSLLWTKQQLIPKVSNCF